MPAEPSNDYRVVVFGAGGEIFVLMLLLDRDPPQRSYNPT